jgi:hypothetical protein
MHSASTECARAEDDDSRLGGLTAGVLPLKRLASAPFSMREGCSKVRKMVHSQRMQSGSREEKRLSGCGFWMHSHTGQGEESQKQQSREGKLEAFDQSLEREKEVSVTKEL